MLKRFLLSVVLIVPSISAEAQEVLECLDANVNVLIREPATYDVNLTEFAEKRCREEPACKDPNAGCQACLVHGAAGQRCLRLMNGLWAQ